MNVGNYIRDLRKQKNLTLHQVSKKTDIDSPLLSKIERGERLPTNQQIINISFCFGTSESDLFTMVIAEKIIKEYGENKITYDALKLAEKKINKQY